MDFTRHGVWGGGETEVGNQKIGGSKTAFGRTIVDSGTTYCYVAKKARRNMLRIRNQRHRILHDSGSASVVDSNFSKSVLGFTIDG